MIKKRRPGSDVFPEYSRKQPSGSPDDDGSAGHFLMPRRENIFCRPTEDAGTPYRPSCPRWQGARASAYRSGEKKFVYRRQSCKMMALFHRLKTPVQGRGVFRPWQPVLFSAAGSLHRALGIRLCTTVSFLLKRAKGNPEGPQDQRQKIRPQQRPAEDLLRGRGSRVLPPSLPVCGRG